MFQGHKVIDVHGHMSTPPQFRGFAYNLIALRTPDELVLTADEMKGALSRHLRLLDDHKIDVQMISARPVAMMHWERPFLVEAWSRTTNNVIAQQCELHPGRFVGIAQLPQNSEIDTSNCVEELERCIKELGFVGATVNPDPGGDRRTPGVNDPYWYPLYAKAQELDATLIIHPSISRDRRVEIIPHNYQYNNLTEEALATLLYEHGDVFDRFPKLRVVVCHCGGALRRVLELGAPVDAVAQARGENTVVASSGEESGGSPGMNRKRKEHVTREISKNLFFDTCAYDPHFLGACIRQRGVDRMVFGTEVPGTGSSMFNPQIKAPIDDVLALIESFDFLTDKDRLEIVHFNPLRTFPLLEKTPALAAAAASR
jgi:predicted TIM-barrel fold metal-dependent hydrolase